MRILQHYESETDNSCIAKYHLKQIINGSLYHIHNNFEVRIVRNILNKVPFIIFSKPL